MNESLPHPPIATIYNQVLADVRKEISSLLPYNVDPDTKPKPGELMELPWPEDEVHDYRLGLSDGRTLAVQAAGLERHYPVILLHGMPGGRIGVSRVEELINLNARLITYDRPGYGRSDSFPGRRVVDCVQDIAAIVHAFGLTNYSIIGRSGGAPHALACAARLEYLPGQVDDIVALVPSAPPEAPPKVRFGTLGIVNLRSDSSSETEIIAAKQDIAAAIRENPLYMLEYLASDLHAEDHSFFGQALGVGRLAASHYFSLIDAQNETRPDGWVEDEIALRRRNWGILVNKAMGRKVTLWAGANDVFTPPEQAIWLAKQIEPEVFHLSEDSSHFSAMDTTVVIDAFLGKRTHEFVRKKSR